MINMVLTQQRRAPHISLLVALLCSTAGAVDFLAVFHVGHLFVANLTGNTVLFAYHAVQRQWAAAAQCLGIILAFFFGVVTHRGFKRWLRVNNPLLKPTAVSLLLECRLLCLLAFLYADGQLRTALLLLLAWSMGLQNDAFQTIGTVSLNTTFLTGDIEKLGALLVSSPADAEQKKQRRMQTGALLIAWSAYVAGAILAALGGHFIETRALLIPAAFTAAALLLELRSR
jgi:uncharacterized membrane protein YoaK (UPF0700 family)